MKSSLNRRAVCGIAIAIAATPAVGAVAAAATGSVSPKPAPLKHLHLLKTVYLVSTNGRNMLWAHCRQLHGCGPTVTAPAVLVRKRRYVIRVTGTVGVWYSWKKPWCGTPLRQAVYPTKPRPLSFSSPHHRGSRTKQSLMVSDDAQFRFADHRPAGGRCLKLPYKTNLFQMNLGHGWFSPTADGRPKRPTRGLHAYKFTEFGYGKRPKFRYIDYYVGDNVGKLKIQVYGVVQLNGRIKRHVKAPRK